MLHLQYLAAKGWPDLQFEFRDSFSVIFVSPLHHTTVKSSMALGEKEKITKKRARSGRDVDTEVDIEDFSREETLKMRSSLLQWYYENQRVLPWRKNQDDEDNNAQGVSDTRAYAVWVSEVMLQQTRVASVIDYYNRWMEKWPTVYHLAQASQEEVNEMWAGLGYYRRARYLLEGAKLIVERGEFPKTVSALREIPGIGDYTAGAIASIAFKETVPVVDGNVVRVIARLKAISANPKEGKTIKSFWKLAGQLVDPLRPGDFNQALMELGATICNPSSPSCSTCPISEQCHALSVSRNCQSIQVTDYPTKIVKAEKRCDFAAVCVVEISEGPDIQEGDHKSKGFLLVKRPEEGLLAGLWEFPSVLLGGEVNLITRRKVMDQYLKKSFNLDAKRNCSIALREVVGEYVHIFSHIQLRMYVELMVLHLKGGENIIFPKMDKETVTWKLVDGKSIQSMGLTSGVRKVYNMIQKFKKSRLSKNPTNHKGKRI
ncbi:PREDICTED: adenine DNA glycosylase [Nelumbo nucifera]|uniref:Adenine DNA glycosylase n=1 Tax=Nelumbo nucifera TaxID=4432 RepID=A0A1U7ZCW6_NELNU|nr:PREDICTED: adenine DNA glycosylase [Nelumbo nucifera]